ncbi:Hypothetical protein HVR_LOCUS981 [uncultured virus]|nr:Hypothetical protein HVR_LOCUS981 [uncultured virus]
MIVYLIRHGECATIGDDVHLTDKGVLNAKKTREYIREFRVGSHRVFTSTLTRSIETAGGEGKRLEYFNEYSNYEIIAKL